MSWWRSVSETRETAKSGGRYVIVSGISFVGTVVLTVLFHELLGLSKEIAYAVTLISVTCSNFLACRYFIFEARSGGFVRQAISFLVAAAGYRAAEYVSFVILHTFLGFHYVAVIIVIQATSFVSKFFFFRAFVFPKKDSTVLGSGSGQKDLEFTEPNDRA